MRGAVFAILGAVCALVLIVTVATPAAPKIEFAVTLGAPSPQDRTAPPPERAMDLAFSGDGARVLARQANGEVAAWDLGRREASPLRRTTGAFAYCPKDDVLVTSDGAGLTLTSLRDRAVRQLGAAQADHAAISADCATVAAAGTASARISVWKLGSYVRFIPAEAARPVRNGLALSADGARLAAATGFPSGEAGEDAMLETFATPADGPATPGVVIGEGLKVGVWRAAFSPDGSLLYAGSQTEGDAGLRAFATGDGAARWGYDGFAAPWIRGVAISPDGAIVATGDEKGMLRLWDGSMGDLLYQGDAGGLIQSLAFSPDGSKLAVGMRDGTIGIVDVAAAVG